MALSDHFVVLKPDLKIEDLPIGPDAYAELDRRFDQFRGHTLISSHQFTEDWNVWERHPAGDELVVLLTGRADMVLRREGADETVTLDEPGGYVIVPQGIWHTARIDSPTTMLFVTPGEGTQNEAEPR